MIDEADFRILDMRYKKIEDCDRDMSMTSDGYHNLDKRMSIMEKSLSINNWLSLAIAGGIVALVIKVYIGG